MTKNNVLITGANNGIGLALVNKYLAEGFIVTALYHNNSSNLEKIQNDNLQIFPVELANETSISEVLEKITKPDILINNAALYKGYESLQSTPSSELKSTLDVNLVAPFTISQWASKGMIDNGFGRIINISSIGIKFGGSPKAAPYMISKAALEAMTMSFAKLAPEKDVLVNAVRVGVTDTEIHQKNPGKDMQARAQLIPIKRMASPDEIAEFIYFLGSEKNTYATGAVHTVAGGE